MPIPAPRAPSDRALLVTSAAAASTLALVTDQDAHRTWGLVAAVGYLLVAAHRSGRSAAAPWFAGVLAGLVPLGVLVLARASTGSGGAPDAFAQPEVRLGERGPTVGHDRHAVAVASRDGGGVRGGRVLPLPARCRAARHAAGPAR